MRDLFELSTSKQYKEESRKSNLKNDRTKFKSKFKFSTVPLAYSFGDSVLNLVLKYLSHPVDAVHKTRFRYRGSSYIY